MRHSGVWLVLALLVPGLAPAAQASSVAECGAIDVQTSIVAAKASCSIADAPDACAYVVAAAATGASAYARACGSGADACTTTANIATCATFPGIALCLTSEAGVYEIHVECLLPGGGLPVLPGLGPECGPGPQAPPCCDSGDAPCQLALLVSGVRRRVGATLGEHGVCIDVGQTASGNPQAHVDPERPCSASGEE